jgi:hypothetical protein
MQTFLDDRIIFRRYPLQVACIGLNKRKEIVFGYLIFLKEVLQEK